jgi:hypothetical protein
MRFEIAGGADRSDGPELTTARVTYSCEITRKEWAASAASL